MTIKLSIRRTWHRMLRLARVIGRLEALTAVAIVAVLAGCNSPTGPSPIPHQDATIEVINLDYVIDHDAYLPEVVTVTVVVRNRADFAFHALEYRINYRWTAYGGTHVHSSDGTLHVELSPGGSCIETIVERVPAVISQVNSIEVLSVR
jgi:hypothetical protein